MGERDQEGEQGLLLCQAAAVGAWSFDKAIKTQIEELIKMYGRKKGVGGAIILDKRGKAYFPLAAATMDRGLTSKDTAYKAKVTIFHYEQLE